MGYPGRNFHYLASEGDLGVAPSHSSPVSTNTEASLPSSYYCSFTVSKSTEASLGTEQPPLFVICINKN
jgi:hypothetical protein